MLAMNSIEDLSEYFDHVDINVINGIFQQLAPEQKQILIDKTNQNILKNVYQSDFKNGVLVVNLLNMP